MARRYDTYTDLRTISEYVTFADAAKILGVSQRHLKRVIDGKVSLSREQSEYLHKAATRARRREGQIASIERAKAMREAKRYIRRQLSMIGHEGLAIPVNLPEFLRFHENGKLGSPVYIYNFRGLSKHDIMQFFRFMKTIIPTGQFFLTYEVFPSGTSPGGTKNYYSNRVSTLSTPYEQFCVTERDMPGNECLVKTDADFIIFYDMINDPSAKRYVIECGVSYERPKWTVPHYELTPEEIADDIARGADPITGKKVIWQD